MRKKLKKKPICKSFPFYFKEASIWVWSNTRALAFFKCVPACFHVLSGCWEAERDWAILVSWKLPAEVFWMRLRILIWFYRRHSCQCVHQSVRASICPSVRQSCLCTVGPVTCNWAGGRKTQKTSKKLKCYRQRDRPTERQTDRPTDRPTDRRSDL